MNRFGPSSLVLNCLTECIRQKKSGEGGLRMNKVYEPNPITLERVRIQKYFIQGITLSGIKE